MTSSQHLAWAIGFFVQSILLALVLAPGATIHLLRITAYAMAGAMFVCGCIATRFWWLERGA